MLIYFYIMPESGTVLFEYGESKESETIQDFINHEDIKNPSYIQVLTCEDHSYTSDNALNDLANHFWRELAKVTTIQEQDGDTFIQEPFHHFPKGTSVYNVWKWIEQEFNVFIGQDLD